MLALPFTADAAAIFAGARIAIAITANRNITARDERTITRAMHGLCELYPRELIFGGARGGDTVALRAAHRYRLMPTRLVVIVPGTVAQQPLTAAMAIRECADEVIELGLPLGESKSYRARNHVMVNRAGNLAGFWGGDYDSGTWGTINHARGQGVPWWVTIIEGSDK